MKLIRRWLATSAPVPDITSDMVSAYLLRATNPDRFAVFDLPAKNAFVQVRRIASGGLHVEVSRRTPELESLLGTLGEMTLLDEYGFPTVNSGPGDDDRVAQVVAQALALIAATDGVANLARVRTG